ncbi:MAG TPA: hypothetical protein VNZ44_12970 [Pyrinomonadaceae bacterium]|nr:hypothetical protein [Pyrinomonadaceae bacterium]
MRPSHARAAAPPLVFALVFTLLSAPLRTPAQAGGAQAQPGGAQAQAGGAQSPEQAPKVFCDPFHARSLVREQLSEAKSFESAVKRISLLTSAADLLWPYDQRAARDLFTEAYELAVKDFREQKDEQVRLAKGVFEQRPDQRFVVMTAVARRDPAWARTLAEGVAEERRRAAEEAKDAAATRQWDGKSKGAEDALWLAMSLLPIDRATALTLARGSFRFPASLPLMLFLFKLAETDGASADALYREALAAYADRTASDLAYLAVYPFALSHDPATVPASVYYRMPPGFSPAPQLRELFLDALFRQVERKFKTPEVAPSDPEGMPTEQAQLLTALVMLEPHIARLNPARLERAQWLKGLASAAASNSSRLRSDTFARFAHENEEEGMFARWVENADRETDAGRRAYAVASIVMAARTEDEFERAEPFLDKVGDAELRQQLAGYFYFLWTQAEVKEGQLDEATRLSKKVGELDYRALLLFEIAEAALKRRDDRSRADELLDSVYADALKAKDTPEKARALLGVASLYTSFDVPRAAQVLRSAVKVIDTLPEPDFSSDSVGRQLGNEAFTVYAVHSLPGIRLGNVFRELGARDFGSALSAANELSDKYLRATAVFALASKCLEESEKQNKENKAAPPPAKPKKPAREP